MSADYISNYGKILRSVLLTIQGYDLPHIDASSAKIARLPVVRKEDLPSLPAIVVAPYGQEQVNSDSDFIPNNKQDVIGYPVLVGIIDRDTNATGNIDDLDTVLYVRQFLRRKLSQETQLAELDIEHKVRIEPSNIRLENVILQGTTISPLLLRVVVYEDIDHA